MSIYQVSRMLGHSSVKTTEIYLGYLAWEEAELVRQAQVITFPGTRTVNLTDPGFVEGLGRQMMGQNARKWHNWWHTPLDGTYWFWAAY